MSSAAIESVIADIEVMGLDELRRIWGRRYGPPPPLRSEPFMRMMLAWRIQANALASTRQPGGRWRRRDRRMPKACIWASAPD